MLRNIGLRIRGVWSASLWAAMVLSSALAAQTRAAAPAPSGTGSTSTPQPGNVLVLIADDLGVDEVGAYRVGSDLPPTPNIDRLAADGLLFRNVWSQPTCSPTRATLQTGRQGFRTSIGIPIGTFSNEPALATSEVTLPEMLDLGTGGRYAHALIGKWHLGSYSSGGDLAPNLAGYAHFAGSLEGQLSSYTYWRKVVDGHVSTSRNYATSECADDALAWIRQQVRPWLCVVAFQAPHAPFHWPPPNLHTQNLPSGSPRPSCSETVGNDPRPYFKAMVEALDTEIGRLLASLPAAERARTTILFLGDNGTDWCLTRPPFSDQAKGTLYEGGVHVPLIASGYAVPARGECASLANTADLFATVAELAGVDLHATLPGLVLDSVSLVPCFGAPDFAPRSFAYAETFTPNGPGNPVPLPSCPASPVCQDDIGFDGPGSVVLSSCGPPLYGLYSANSVPWRISGAPVGARGWLLVGSYSPAFVPGLGALIVPRDYTLAQPFVTGAAGGFASTLWTGGTTREPYYQVVVADPAQPLGYAVSNALRMDMLWTDMRAARNARYKLIRFDPCKEQFYDLVADPFEHVELLARGLTSSERAAYDELVRDLASLR